MKYAKVAENKDPLRKAKNAIRPEAVYKLVQGVFYGLIALTPFLLSLV